MAGAGGALLVGVAVGVLIVPSPAPEALKDVGQVEKAPVTYSDFDDPWVVQVQVTAGTDIPLTVQAAGRVTENACDPAIDLTSGSSNFALDGVRLVNLATRVPLWRDLRIGDRGDDVAALQEELARLGHAVGADGRFGRETFAALNAVVQAAGSPAFSGGVVSVSRIVWLPASTTAISECLTTVGAYLSAGDPFASARATGHAGIATMPTQLVDGDRVLLVDGVRVPVDAAGVVVDRVGVDALRATPSYLTARESTKTGSIVIAGSLRLAAPISVAGVPPSAVVTDQDGVSCVFSGPKSANPYLVNVVGSVLGQSLLTFESPKPPTDVAIDPDQPACK